MFVNYDARQLGVMRQLCEYKASSVLALFDSLYGITQSHLDCSLWCFHADHAQVVLLPALHVGLALLPHRPDHPHPVRMLGLSRHGRNANWMVHLGMSPMAVSIAIVGLFAKSANMEVGQYAHLPAAEAVNDLGEREGAGGGRGEGLLRGGTYVSSGFLHECTADLH